MRLPEQKLHGCLHIALLTAATLHRHSQKETPLLLAHANRHPSMVNLLTYLGAAPAGEKPVRSEESRYVRAITYSGVGPCIAPYSLRQIRLP